MNYITAKESIAVDEKFDLIFDLISDLDVLIFGGFARDLVSSEYNNEPFYPNDIDIIALPKSHNKLLNKLFMNDFFGVGISKESMSTIDYDHWGAVKSVTTVSNKKFVDGVKIQVINIKNNSKLSTENVDEDFMKSLLLEPVEAVDLICCSLAITPNKKLISCHPNAVEHCEKKLLVENEKSSYKANIDSRIKKLQKRGWKLFEEKEIINQLKW